jgi:hypothetical protein
MSIRFTCLGCGKPLQTPDELAGKRIRCAGCQQIIRVPDGAEPEPQSFSSRPQKSRPDTEAAGPRRTDRPRRVEADDEGSAQRRGGRSRREYEDDEDETPRSRRQPRDEDEAADHDTGDEGDRPRRRGKKRRRQAGGSPLKIVLILGAIACLLLCMISIGGGAAWYFFFRGDRDSLAADMKYLPDQCAHIRVFQLDVARSSPAYAEFLKCPNAKQQLAFTRTPHGKELDIKRAIIAGTLNEDVTILTMRNPVAIQDLLDPGVSAAEVQMGGKTVYTVGDKTYYIEGKRVIIASADRIRLILTRNVESKQTEHMKLAIKEADFSKPIVHLEDIFSRDAPHGLAEVLGSSVPQCVVVESDLQLPLNVLVKLMCKDSAAATSIGQKVRSEAIGVAAKVLAGATVEVKDTMVVIRFALPAADICNGPH